MNKVVIIGRLTKNPELKFIPGNGTAVTTITVAVDRRKKEDGTDFIQCTIWGKSAENTANYMTKGRLIGVSGRIQTRSYEAKDGTKRFTTEVVADEVQFLEKASPSGIGSNDNSSIYSDEMRLEDSEEIPF